MPFAALHEPLHGTKQKPRPVRLMSAFGEKADIRKGHAQSIHTRPRR